MAFSNRMQFIARTTLTGTASSVSFQNISSLYRKFHVIAFIVKDATTNTVNVRFNNDSGANYAFEDLTANGATAAGARTTGSTAITPSTSIAASSYGLLTLDIAKPLTSTTGRVVAHMSKDGNATGIFLNEIAGEWTNTTNLISRIDILAVTGNFAAGTLVLLYGSRD